MSTGDIFNIRDESNIERLVGTINDPQATTGHVLTVQADKSVKAAAGGGSQPVLAWYTGTNTPVTIPSQTNGLVAFDTLAVGTELLDRTDPLNPIILAAGAYIISVSVAASTPLTAGSIAALTVSTSGTGGLPGGPGQPSAGERTDQEWTVTWPFTADAGDVLNANIFNGDTVADRVYNLYDAFLMKLG